MSTLRRRLALLFAGLVGAALLLLLAGSPRGLGEHALEYTGPQSAKAGRVRPLPSTAVTSPLGRLGGQLDLFPVGSLVVLRGLATSDGATCVQTVTSSLSLVGAWATEDACTITTTLSARRYPAGPCFTVSPGETVNQVVEASSFGRTVAIRSLGYCSTGTVTAIAGDKCFPYCRSNTDCTELGAGSTCTLFSSLSAASRDAADMLLRDQACAGFICKPQSNATPIAYRLEE